MHCSQAPFILLALATLANPCHAAQPEASEAPASQPADASRPQANEEANPRRTETEYDVQKRYTAARELYAAGDLPGSLRILRECYEVTRATNLLFNIAQLHRELGECSDAVEHYQRYITESPDGARVADAKQYLDVLTAQCPPTRATEPTPASRAQKPLQAASASGSNSARLPPPIPVDSGAPAFRHWNMVGWAALGVGALATAGSVYARVEMAHAYGDTEDANEEGDRRSAEKFREDWYRNRRWAFGLGAAAVVSVGFGVYALLIAAPSEGRPTHSVSTTLTPNSALLDYGWRF